VRNVATFFLSLLLVAPSAHAKRAPQNPSAKPEIPLSQSAPPSGSVRASTDQVKIDPAKEADIHRLVDLSGTKAAMTQIIDGMEKNMRPWVTSSLPEGDYREKLVDLFLQKFHDHLIAEIPQLVDSAVPLYDKYFSREDIQGLIRFYETPLGQKALGVLPKLSMEIQAEGMKLGEMLGRQSMMEVLSDHPELQKALEEARTGAPPQ
jgi:hypothetical protein